MSHFFVLSKGVYICLHKVWLEVSPKGITIMDFSTVVKQGQTIPKSKSEDIDLWIFCCTFLALTILQLLFNVVLTMISKKKVSKRRTVCLWFLPCQTAELPMISKSQTRSRSRMLCLPSCLQLCLLHYLKAQEWPFSSKLITLFTSTCHTFHSMKTDLLWGQHLAKDYPLVFYRIYMKQWNGRQVDITQIEKDTNRKHSKSATNSTKDTTVRDKKADRDSILHSFKLWYSRCHNTFIMMLIKFIALLATFWSRFLLSYSYGK